MKKILFFTFCIFIMKLFSQEINFTENELQIPTKNTLINGTILIPKAIEKPPLVILIPGSGPTDRDGNNQQLKNNSLKFLAEELAKNNIAVFRYDKSVISLTKNDTISATQLNELLKEITFDSFIEDAKDIVSFFKTNHAYSKIIIAGHSQGSLVGMIAANNNANAFISLGGAGNPIDKVITMQIEKQAPFLKEETIKIVSELKQGNTVENVNPMLLSVFNKQVQPFLTNWMQYNPQHEIAKLTMPVLIINGTKDIQVSVDEAKLLHLANEHSKLHIVENMNHIFKEIKGDNSENIQSYTNPDLPVMPEMVILITNFINEAIK